MTGEGQVTYEVGLAGILVDRADATPGGFCRDEILAHVAEELSSLVDLEVREVLSAELPMACLGDQATGELLIMGAPGVGGPLATAEAARVIAELARLGPSGSFPGRSGAVLASPGGSSSRRGSRCEACSRFRPLTRSPAWRGRTWSPSPTR